MNLKKRAEALLFSSGRNMKIDELMKLCRASYEELDKDLHELQKDYEEKQSSLMVVQEGDAWKISVREEHLPLVQKIVTQTELPKSLMETLAVIAFKYPIKQSDLIKLRTNKAYDHLLELEEKGYIVRQKFSRTKLIKLSQKFFDYFSLSEEKLKEQFKDFTQIAATITEKEKEIEKLKEEQEKQAEEARKEKEEREKAGGIEIDDMEVYERPKEQPKIEILVDSIGEMAVVDTPETKEVAKKEEKQEVVEEESEEQSEESEEESETEEENPEVENEIDALLHPKKEDDEETEEEKLKEIFDPDEKK